MMNDETDGDLEPIQSLDIRQIASDVEAAYGDLSKGFCMAMLRRCMTRHDRAAEDWWLAVAQVIYEVDPIPSAGCPAHLANKIRLH